MPSKVPSPMPAPASRRLPLNDLQPRCGYAGRLTPRMRKALSDHIATAGLYPPLIVRRHPRCSGKYEILDGHHRAEILRSLGSKTARCEVWRLDDEQADLYVATLDVLGGRSDGVERARRLQRLLKRYGQTRTAAMLGATPAGIRQQLAPLKAPTPTEAPKPALALQAVTFHLPPDQAALLAKTLRPLPGRRGEALMAAIQAGNPTQNDLPE